MSTKSRDKDSMKMGSLKGDDLSLIRGIGPARRQWLRERLHIETVADLAAASADEIYTRLKEEQIVSLSKIESWIEQAKEIVESGVYISKLKVQENGWNPFASFVVEFQEEVTTGHRQTKAHYIEGDKTIKWPGTEHEALCNWFMEQLGGKVHSTVTHQIANNPAQKELRLFSDHLQTILAKVTTVSNQPQSQPMLKTLPAPLPIEKSTKPPASTGFSDKLQETLERIQKIAANSS